MEGSNTISERPLVARVATLGPFADDAHARRAIRATLAALGERLEEEEQRILAAALPARFARAVLARRRVRDSDVEHFYARVRQREHLGAGVAREHAQAVCRAVGEQLPDDARTRLLRDLPASFAALLGPAPEEGAPPVSYREGAAMKPAPRVAVTHHTLATGRPSSAHPLSEAKPREAHAHSVAESNPHADTKLSSARGMTQETAKESLATAVPGDRSIADSSD